MREMSYVFSTLEHPYQLAEDFIQEVREMKTPDDTAVFFQIYTGNLSGDGIAEILSIIRRIMPDALVAGTSSSGEIVGGEKYNDTTAISVMFFESSEVHVFTYDCDRMSETDAGRSFAGEIDEIYNVAGIEILDTASRMRSETFFNELSGHIEGIPFFGGGSARLSIFSNDSFVFDRDNVIKTGIVAVVFSGVNLHMTVTSFSGWQPIGKEMHATLASERCIKQINGLPAMKIYEKYLMIHDDENFKSQAMEFPLFLKRGDDYLPRIPGKADEDGGLHFIVDVQQGDAVRIAYGDPGKIIEGAVSVPLVMKEFEPEYIILIACDGRQVFLKENAGLEMQPFTEISANAGFYSHGEIVLADGRPVVNNTLLVAVGMREGDKKGRFVGKILPFELAGKPNIPGNPLLVSKLTNFLEVMARE